MSYRNKGSIQVWFHNQGGVPFLKKLIKKNKFIEDVYNILVKDYNYTGSKAGLYYFCNKENITFVKAPRKNTIKSHKQKKPTYQKTRITNKKERPQTFKVVKGPNKTEFKKLVEEAKYKSGDTLRILKENFNIGTN